MLITYLPSHFLWHFKCERGDSHHPKNAFFNWDTLLKKWVTRNPMIAKQAMSRYNADENAKHALVEFRKRFQFNYNLSSSVDPVDNLRCPDGLTYYPYQQAGIEYLLRNPDCILADDMGLGKTICIAGLINNDLSLRRNLIICPASLKFNWVNELKKWLIDEFDVFVPKSDKSIPIVLPEYFVMIVNYERIPHMKHRLDKIEFDLLACDEAHYLKNYQAKRTANVLGYFDYKNQANNVPALKGRRKVFASATIMPNRPRELFPVLSAIDKHYLGNFWYFMTRYCGVNMDSDVKNFDGAANLKELGQMLRGNCMVRRTKKVAAPFLPGKTFQLIELDSNKYIDGLLSHERRVYDGIDDWTDISVDGSRCAIAISEIANMRLEIARAKLPAMFQTIDDIVTAGEKVIFFAHHREILKEVFDRYSKKAVLFYGGMTDKARDLAVNSFMGDRSCMVFCGSIMASGLGLTLTSAWNVVFGEVDWSPSTMEQAMDRADRIGQKHPVLVKFILHKKSIDSIVIKRSIAKSVVVNEVMS